MNVTEWQVSWNSCSSHLHQPIQPLPQQPAASSPVRWLVLSTIVRIFFSVSNFLVNRPKMPYWSQVNFIFMNRIAWTLRVFGSLSQFIKRKNLFADCLLFSTSAWQTQVYFPDLLKLSGCGCDMAQLLRCLTRVHKVVGSIPSLGMEELGSSSW